LSSAILYLAIVAIWGGVLIPRWLRRDTSRAHSRRAGQGARSDEPVAEEGPGNIDGEAGEADAGTSDLDAGAMDADTGPGEVHGYEASENDMMEFRPPDPESRKRALAARRRMLMMLVGLTGAAFGIVVAKLAVWWVTIPPTMMLAGYLMLLREARHADAEREHAMAEAMARAQERRRRAREREMALRRERVVAAPVIDISGRVKDELYDQYADTERRAVGD
jgi:hypothetical protein